MTQTTIDALGRLILVHALSLLATTRVGNNDDANKSLSGDSSYQSRSSSSLIIIIIQEE
jgi:hypothetical protein